MVYQVEEAHDPYIILHIVYIYNVYLKKYGDISDC